MLAVISALLLALVGSLVFWQHKPQGEQPWRGSDAAYFMVGLAAACFGYMSLLSPTDASTLSLMLKQLCLYAALPLLVCLELAQWFKRDWNRQIWGRVLLAVAAVFELCRRNAVLDELLLVCLVLGVVAFALTARSKAYGLGWLQAGLWLALAVNTWSQWWPLPETLLCALACATVINGRLFARAAP